MKNKKFWIEKNFILPIEKINITHDELIDFNNSFGEIKRAEILKSYLGLINDLQEYCTEDFKVWLCGSFISGKKEPNDLDIKIFISEYDYKNLLEMIGWYYQNMDSLKLHISFFNFNPCDELSEHNNYKLNEELDLIYNRRVGDEIAEKCSGFFEIDYFI